MNARRPVLWEIIQRRLSQDWTDLREIYSWIETELAFDAEDLEPPADYAPTDTKWQRNVRNLLLYRTRTGDLDWDGAGRYRRPNHEGRPAHISDAEAPSIVESPAEEAVRPRGVGQGRISDPALRAAIERHAMSLVSAHLATEGWNVQDVSAFESYDLACARDAEVVHIEVKGTTGLGREVDLTWREVEHARMARVLLAVVSRIRVIKRTPPLVEGGELVLISPWVPDPAKLKPTTYRYRL